MEMRSEGDVVLGGRRREGRTRSSLYIRRGVVSSGLRVSGGGGVRKERWSVVKQVNEK